MKRGRDHWKSLGYVALLKDNSTMIVITNVNVQPFNPCYQVGLKLWHAAAVLACGGQRRCRSHAVRVEEHRF
jgi:hypothetical protein